MKTSLTYAAGMTLAGALLVFVLYFLGFHSDPAKLSTGQMIQAVMGIAITISGLILGLRARREEIPAADGFSYGKAVGNGAAIAAFSALFSSIFNFIYTSFINPQMVDMVVSAQLAKMEEQGVPQEGIEGTEKIIRLMSSPAVSSALALFFGFLITFIIVLIIAAFLKRPATEDIEPPPLNA